MQARTNRKPPKRVIPAPIVHAVAEEIVESPNPPLNPAWITAVAAAEEKQAININVLDIRDITTMADVFLICHGRNLRQNQAIAEEVEKRLKEVDGERPIAIEGAQHGEWILMDYGDIIVHIFSEKAREYYDLDRLYRDGRKLRVQDFTSATQ